MSEKIILKKIIKDISELNLFAKELQSLLSRDAVVLLSGEMGAGKTELVKQWAGIFQCQAVASPTFAFHHHYQGSISFDHWDLFRTENEDELESTGFWELLQTKSLVFVEWPEKLNLKHLPLGRDIYKIHIEMHGKLREIQLAKIN